MRKIVFAILIAIAPAAASADLEIFACEPEWAALAKKIGQSHVNTFSATTALQDPHYIQARPSLIAKVRRADLVICSGAELEIGWLPALLRKANNREVLPGSRGYFEASSYVVRLDATGSTDRAQGDIHPLGNPHIQANPHNIAAVAKALGARLGQLDPGNAADYEAGLKAFLLQWQNAIQVWETRAAPLRGTRAITHHKSWVYLEQWLGIEEAANLEAIPGLPPTATHLSKLTEKFEQGDADFIIRSPYQDDRPSEWLSERVGVPELVLPLTVGGTDEAQDLFSLFDDIIDRLLQALNDE
ncbi:MAG: zinc ABC transporter solute-binding protein [Gammaproteobacteria bacterium]|nr:zinc ABC transporter solute-binding protein [Gammaproteobacteria bacterium]